MLREDLKAGGKCKVCSMGNDSYEDMVAKANAQRQLREAVPVGQNFMTPTTSDGNNVDALPVMPSDSEQCTAALSSATANEVIPGLVVNFLNFGLVNFNLTNFLLFVAILLLLYIAVNL
jgi:hypothetical protein